MAESVFRNMESVEKSVFDTLRAVDVSAFVERKPTGKKDKNGKDEYLSYLSWANAWEEVIKRYPDAVCKVHKDANGLPYVYDEKTGYMVETSVTIRGMTHDMCLPVMDNHNRAMKAEPYTIKSKWGATTVQAATMFDINTAIMRCKVKNLALFGLGLGLYQGEDFPDDGEPEQQPPQKSQKVEQQTSPSHVNMTVSDKVPQAWNVKDAMNALLKMHDMSINYFKERRQLLIDNGLIADIPSCNMTKTDFDNFVAIFETYNPLPEQAES